MRNWEVLAIFSWLYFAAGALAAGPGDPVKGLAYAKDVCAECHAVNAGAKVSPNIKAPAFQAIAHSKLVTTREITAWLQSSHPDMPDLLVPHDKREDVIAYIRSLAE